MAASLRRGRAGPVSRLAAAGSWLVVTLALAPVVSAASGAAFASASAGGEPGAGSPVELLLESCPQVDEKVLRHMLSLEIGDLLLTEPPAAAVPRQRLTVRCAAGQARLTVAGSARAPAVERTVRLADFPDDATPRVLALAGVELLASIDAPAAPAPAPALTAVKGPIAPPAAPDPATRKDAEDPQAASRSLLARARFALVVMRRSFLADAGVTSWGASASAASDLNAGWAVRADLDGGVAHSSSAAGAADTYLLSAGAFWGPRFGRGDMVGSLGIGARVGLTRLAGQSGFADTSSVMRAWGGPTMMVQVRNGGEGWGLMLYAESGATVLGAVGSSDQGPVAAVRGIWLTVGAGISL